MKNGNAYVSLELIIRHVRKVMKIALKSDQNKGYFTLGSMYIHDTISLNFSLNGNCFRQNLVQRVRTHMFNDYSPKIVPFVNLCEKNVVQRNRPQIMRMRYA